MENDLAHAECLEDNLTRRNEFANPEPDAAAPNEGRIDATKRARRDEIEPLQESANTGGLRAARLELMWIIDRYTLAKDRWSQATLRCVRE